MKKKKSIPYKAIKYGAGGDVTGAVASTADNMFPDSPLIGDASKGLALGTQVGSLFGPVGTAIGAGAGLLLGGAYGAVQSGQVNKAKTLYNTNLNNSQEMERKDYSSQVYGQKPGMLPQGMTVTPVAEKGMQVDSVDGGMFTGKNDAKTDSLKIIKGDRVIGKLQGNERIFSREDTELMDHLARNNDFANLGLHVASAIARQKEQGPQYEAADGTQVPGEKDKSIFDYNSWDEFYNANPPKVNFSNPIVNPGTQYPDPIQPPQPPAVIPKAPVSFMDYGQKDEGSPTPLNTEIAPWDRPKSKNVSGPTSQVPDATEPGLERKNSYTGEQVFANVAEAGILATNLLKKYTPSPTPILQTFEPYHYDTSSMLNNMLGDINTQAAGARYNTPASSAGDALSRELSIQANENDQTVNARDQINKIDQEVSLKNTDLENNVRSQNVNTINQHAQQEYANRANFAGQKSAAVSQNIQSIIDTNANFRTAKRQDDQQLINLFAANQEADIYAVNERYKNDSDPNKGDFTSYYYKHRSAGGTDDLLKNYPFLTSRYFKKRTSPSLIMQ